MKDKIDPTHGACALAIDCLSDKVSLLKNMRTGLVDPDTPDSVKTKTAKDGTKLKLVVGLLRHSIAPVTDIFSSLMNSIKMAELSTTVMILSSKPWIFGMVLLKIWNGMIQMP